MLWYSYQEHLHYICVCQGQNISCTLKTIFCINILFSTGDMLLNGHVDWSCRLWVRSVGA